MSLFSGLKHQCNNTELTVYMRIILIKRDNVSKSTEAVSGMRQALNNQHTWLSVPEILHPQIQPTGVQKYLGKKFQKVPPKKQNLNLPCNSYIHSIYIILDFPGSSDGKESACNAGDPGSISGLGRSSGEQHGNPLQYSRYCK